MNEKLPKGFENPPKETTRSYRSNDTNPNSPQTVNFRRRPGGDPGRGMAQTVEHAANTKGTLSRLMQYFRQANKLLIMLLVAVVCVTLAGLLAPSLQGSAIDAIKERAWKELSSCVIFLLAVED